MPKVKAGRTSSGKHLKRKKTPRKKESARKFVMHDRFIQFQQEKKEKSASRIRYKKKKKVAKKQEVITKKVVKKGNVVYKQAKPKPRQARPRRVRPLRKRSTITTIVDKAQHLFYRKKRPDRRKYNRCGYIVLTMVCLVLALIPVIGMAIVDDPLMGPVKNKTERCPDKLIMPERRPCPPGFTGIRIVKMANLFRKDELRAANEANETVDVTSERCAYLQCEYGWLVFQRRFYPFKLDMDRNWLEYKWGFGERDNRIGEFWLGLRALNIFTKREKYSLRIDAIDSKWKESWWDYYSFEVKDEPNKFRYKIVKPKGKSMGVGSGDMEDPLVMSTRRGGRMNGVPFHAQRKNFTRKCPGTEAGWWYENKKCYETNFNTNFKACGSRDNGKYIRFVNKRLEFTSYLKATKLSIIPAAMT